MGRRRKRRVKSSKSSEDESLSEGSQSDGQAAPLTCLFCKNSNRSDLECGPILHEEETDTAAHLFCMYFSAALTQDADLADDDPFAGFSIPAVKKEARRGNRLKCDYCGKHGATMGCCVSTCKTKFHLPCGRKNGTFHYFFGTYESFCKDHVPVLPRQKRDPRIPRRFCFYGEGRVKCLICMEWMSSQPSATIVVATCCPSSRFHYTCIQNYASSAAEYHLRCPACNNDTKFRDDVLHCGVYIPSRDAQWELDRQYEDLYIRPSRCSADSCRCTYGREFNSEELEDGDDWHFLSCNDCGAAVIHSDCRENSDYGRMTEKYGSTSSSAAEEKWLCKDCTAIPIPAKMKDAVNELNLSPSFGLRSRASPDSPKKRVSYEKYYLLYPREDQKSDESKTGVQSPASRPKCSKAPVAKKRRINFQ